MADFHFLRPEWLWSLLPLIGLLYLSWHQQPRLQSWDSICDAHLLRYLVKNKRANKRFPALLLLFFATVFMIIGLAGPTWSRLPVPAYQKMQARVIVLDMSEAMLEKDLSPDRLTRAKFKLHDLFSRREAGQTGMIVFTGEPFVVSPLTDDEQTIDSLLSSLTPEVMPVGGQRLNTALDQAAQLIKQAGFKEGEILVLTATTPNAAAIDTAAKLAAKGIFTSIMPIVADHTLSPLFQPLADAGHGQLLLFSDSGTDLAQWFKKTAENGVQYTRNDQDDIPIWRDEGRWFLLPALILLLPVFRRGWLQRIDS